MENFLEKNENQSIFGEGIEKSMVPPFYPRDAMLARVFAIATCPDVCLSVWTSVRHTPVLCLAERKQDREMYTF